MTADIKFTLNGENIAYKENPSERLLDFLRDKSGLTGTKCGCKEGECGACAVIINNRLVNSCLVAMGSLSGADVVTIEGFSKTERFSVLDEAYASVSAVQCGFCIPGMMMASESILAANPDPTEEDIRVGISGNLCRCTGYNSIVKAIKIASKSNHPSLKSGNELFNSKQNTFTDFNSIPATQFAPTTLADALNLRRNSSLIPYSGGTDLMVSGECADSGYMFLNNVFEMSQITADEKYIRIGAACTFTEIIENPLTPPILKEACLQIAAPAIRNVGTPGGNIANGSAKADSALIFMVTDSNLRLANADNERIVPIKEFYSGKGKTILASDELIVEILMPKSGIENYYYKKVGARNALSIARTSFAGILDIDNGAIVKCAVAFGAVCDVIIHCDEIDNMLTGKTIKEAIGLKETYIKAYDNFIQPRHGRVSIEYRKDICMNLLRDFLDTKLINLEA